MFRSLSRALLLALLLTGAGLTGGLATVHADGAPPTPGCGRAWTPGANVQGTLSFDGLTRSYLLHIPSGYSSAAPTALVLNLHGAGMNAWEQALLTHMSAVADANDFLAVYPNGTGSPAGWNVFPAGMAGTVNDDHAGVDDVGFLNALVASLEGQLCVDTSRIGVAGFSLGAAMAYHLACADTPWLAAIAAVGGTMPQPVKTCSLAHATPLIAFHGVDDPVVPYAGGGPTGMASSPTVVAVWAMLDGCAMTARNVLTQGDVTAFGYSACADGAAAQLYTITDGGHTWPGGLPLPQLGVTTNAVDASSAIWSFVNAHPLTTAAPAADSAATSASPTASPAASAASSVTATPMASPEAGGAATVVLPAATGTATAPAATRPAAHHRAAPRRLLHAIVRRLRARHHGA